VQELQLEAAVLLNVPPIEKAQTDISLLTSLPWHSGHSIFSDSLKTILSNSIPHRSQRYSYSGI
jgi:hypothetical protein